jgi:hypothetical protein
MQLCQANRGGDGCFNCKTPERSMMSLILARRLPSGGLGLDLPGMFYILFAKSIKSGLSCQFEHRLIPDRMLERRSQAQKT